MKSTFFLLFTLVYSLKISAQNKVLIVLKPNDCVSCNLAIGNLIKFIPDSSSILLLPKYGLEEYKSVENLLVLKKCKRIYTTAESNFDTLFKMPSSIYVLNNKDELVYKSLISKLDFQKIFFVRTLIQNSFKISISKEIKLPLEINSNLPIKKSNKTIHCIDSKSEYLQLISSDTISSFDIKPVITFLTRGLEADVIEERSMFKKIGMNSDEIFEKDLGRERISLVNYSISESSYVFLFQVKFLNVNISSKKDTTVIVEERSFLVVHSLHDNLNKIITFDLLNHPTHYTANLFGAFEVLGDNLLLSVIPLNRPKDSISFGIVRTKIRDEKVNFNKVLGVSYMPDLLRIKFNNQFSSVGSSDNILFYQNAPSFVNLVSGTNIKIHFNDSLFYKYGFDNEEFDINGLLDYYYCHDVIQIDKNAYSLIFFFKNKFYHAQIIKGKPADIKYLFDNKNFTFVGFMGPNKIVRIKERSKVMELMELDLIN